jgi:hypothetical protein
MEDPFSSIEYLSKYFNGSNLKEDTVVHGEFYNCIDEMGKGAKYSRGYTLRFDDRLPRTFDIVERIEILNESVDRVDLYTIDGYPDWSLPINNNIVNLPCGMITSVIPFSNIYLKFYGEGRIVGNVQYKITGVYLLNEARHILIRKVSIPQKLKFRVQNSIDFNCITYSNGMLDMYRMSNPKELIKLQRSCRKFLFRRKLNKALTMKEL